MAKPSKGSSNSIKTTFGKKTKRKTKKSYGPKEQKPKKYRGQGK